MRHNDGYTEEELFWYYFAPLNNYNKYIEWNIMSTEDNKSLLQRLGQDENKDAIPNRIQFVKSLLNDNSLKTIINFITYISFFQSFRSGMIINTLSRFHENGCKLSILSFILISASFILVLT